MFEFLTLKEERFIHKNFDFRILSEEEGFESPYLFNKYFNDISYNTFVQNITELLKFIILNEELNYLKTFFGKKKINNVYTISKLIKNDLHSEFIDNVIICKRIEFLHDYICKKKMPTDYIEYVDNLLISLYKTRNFLVKQIY